jgi:hypothetical protein
MGGRTRLLDLASGEEVLSVSGPVHLSGPLGAFAEGGKAFAAVGVAFDDPTRAAVVRVYDLTTGEERRAFKAAPLRMFNLAVSPDGRRVALAPGDGGRRPDGRVLVWDVTTGKELTVLPHEGAEMGLKLSPDGSLLALADDESTLRVCDAATGAEWPRPEADADTLVYALAFSRDGRLLAGTVMSRVRSEMQTKVCVWEVVSGRLRAEFPGHRGFVTALAFSPDGRTLASGGHDTTVLLWDLYGSAPAGKLSARDLESLWADLDGDGRRAHRALARLAAAPAEAVALVRERLPPDASKSPSPEQVKAWIAELDADDFDKREKASRELRQAGRAVRLALTAAMEAKPSPEKRRRLQELLDALKRTGPPPEMVRPTRALELLERLGTPEARRLLEELARGNPDAPLTLEAQATLRRLK